LVPFTGVREKLPPLQMVALILLMSADGLIVIVLVALTAGQGPGPSGSSLVRVSVTVPEYPAPGVKVTVPGVVVEPVLLNVPLPEVTLHVPEVVPPEMLAPLRVMAVGGVV
jgi:hypothetical protein